MAGMDSSKGPSPWLSPVLAVIGILLAAFWAYIQTLHWRQPNADYTSIFVSAILTFGLWMLLWVAAIANFRDVRRVKKLQTTSETTSTVDLASGNGILGDFTDITILDADYGSDQFRKPALEGLRAMFLSDNSRMPDGSRSIGVQTKPLVGTEPHKDVYKYLKVSFSVKLHEGKSLVIRPGERLLGASKGSLPALVAKRGPNLIYQGSRVSRLHLSQWDREGLREPNNAEEDKHAFEAIVLKFENEPRSDGTTTDSSDLIARIVYRLTGGEVKRIDFAVWLNSSLRSHYIEIGETHELLLLFRKEPQEFLALEDKRVMNQHFSDPWSWFRPEDFLNVESAEVTITDQESQLRFVFDFVITSENGKLRVSLPKTQM
jgi:hypothetical protein